jgi:hypothetical protein
MLERETIASWNRCLLFILPLALAAVISVACGSPPASLPTPITLQENFEAHLGNWETGADVPEDADRPGHPVACSIELSQDQSSEGAVSARFFLNGKHDDGTIWLVRPFNVPANRSETVRWGMVFREPGSLEIFLTIAGGSVCHC